MRKLGRSEWILVISALLLIGCITWAVASGQLTYVDETVTVVAVLPVG